MSEASPEDQKWVVFDIETTGLVPSQCQILECAAIYVRPSDLYALDAVTWLVTHGVPGDMPRIVQEMHTKSGLLEDLAADRVFLKASGQLLDNAHGWLDRVLAAYFAGISPAPRSIVLIGNSIHFDRSFLEYHCPTACKSLHHRMIDVSCLRTLYRAWVGEPQIAGDAPAHRAMADCAMSLQGLRWFARNLFHKDVPLL